MADKLELLCDEELVKLLYYVLLGRDPESNDILLGAPLSEAATHFISSDEFAVIAASCLALNFPDPPHQKSRQARSDLAKALVQFGAPTPRSTAWLDLLVAGLIWLRNSLPEQLRLEVAAPLIDAIESAYVGPVEIEDVLDELLRFDPEWFRMANKQAGIPIDLSEAEFERHVVEAVLKGDAELFPLFTISGPNNEQMRAAILPGTDKTSISSILEQLRKRVGRGEVQHWLFEESYYLRMRAKLFDETPKASWKPLKHAYLDFIVHGSKSRVRPHPLFCFTTYETLNSIEAPEYNLFAHYLRTGQFAEFRTSVLFDRDFYTALNARVLLDFPGGRYRSALESFCREGLTKGFAFSPDFDPVFYLAAMPDGPQMEDSSAGNLAWHFLSKGACAGLQSSPYFDPIYYARRYPAAAQRCQKLNIAPLEDFILFGKNKGLNPCPSLADREVNILEAKAIYERRALDSLGRLVRKPLDFTDFCGSNPILSVVVPVHNQESFTARFLEQAYYACAELKRQTGALSEVIVVSNGSRDQTDQLLRTVPGITALMLADGVGFTKAVNYGAKIAAGRFLVIANNDIEFDPGTFADVVSSFGETPDCGVLGARVLSMDMTVQEVGSFLSRDGSTGGHERGARSSHHLGQRKRIVDYVSGCFLCLERGDFEMLGGFDEDFAPGYYEEVDLCLRMANKLSKHVMVDPTLTVLHYENASYMQGRAPAALYPLILKNRQKLMRKHPAISQRQSLDHGYRAITAEANVSQRTKILVIVGAVPDPLLDDDIGRTALILRAFHGLELAYDVIALHPSDDIDKYEFADVPLHRAWMPSEGIDSVLGHDGSAYSHIWVAGADVLTILFDHLYRYRKSHPITIICDSAEISAQRAIATARLNGNHLDDSSAIDLVAAEFSLASVADLLIAANDREADLIRAAGFNRVTVVNVELDGADRSPGDVTDNKDSLAKTLRQVEALFAEVGADVRSVR